MRACCDASWKNGGQIGRVSDEAHPVGTYHSSRIEHGGPGGRAFSPRFASAPYSPLAVGPRPCSRGGRLVVGTASTPVVGPTRRSWSTLQSLCSGSALKKIEFEREPGATNSHLSPDMRVDVALFGAAPSRGRVAGRLWNPPPPPGWLAGWRAPRKQPKYAVHHCTASSHAWYGYGDGFARVGGGRPPFKNTLTSYSKLPCLRNLP